MKLKASSIFYMFLLFLPFTQALTINVGFPLKFSELLLLVLLLFYMFNGKMSKKFLIFLLKNKILIVFLLWTIISFIVNIFWKYDYPLKKVPFRINSIGDSFLRLGYIILCLLTFFISWWFISKTTNILKYWVVGAVIASFYSWYLFVSSGLDIPYVKLFGMEEHPQALYGFVRSGTFKEGNFFGMYLLISSIISFYIKKTRIAVFLLLTILTTFSTISIISSFIFLLFLFRRSFLKKKRLFILVISLPIIFFLGLYLQNTTFFKEKFYSKINQPANKLSINNFSKVDRTLTARIAYKQGINNPILGVGPYNYGLHYDEYNDFKKYIINNSEWSLNYFQRKNIRAIANNVYFEVWAEYGIIGFLLFISFLGKTLIISFKNKNDIITGGIIALFISFNAFPSFIMLFIWMFLAIPYSIYYQKKKLNI